jgi:hypothetical protein
MKHMHKATIVRQSEDYYYIRVKGFDEYEFMFKKNGTKKKYFIGQAIWVFSNKYKISKRKPDYSPKKAKLLKEFRDILDRY